MTESEALFYLGALVGSWLAGFAAAFLLKTIKQFVEKI